MCLFWPNGWPKKWRRGEGGGGRGRRVSHRREKRITWGGAFADAVLEPFFFIYFLVLSCYHTLYFKLDMRWRWGVGLCKNSERAIVASQQAHCCRCVYCLVGPFFVCVIADVCVVYGMLSPTRCSSPCGVFARSAYRPPLSLVVVLVYMFFVYVFFFFFKAFWLCAF